jgi:hypothetical protein
LIRWCLVWWKTIRVAVLQTIWRDFPVVWTLLLAVLLGCVGMLHRVLVPACKPDTVLQTSPWVKLVLSIVVFFALVFAGKGTLREMALQRQHLTVTTSQFLERHGAQRRHCTQIRLGQPGQSQNLQDPLAGLKPWALIRRWPLPRCWVCRMAARPQVKAALTAPRSPAEGGTQEESAVLPDGILERRAHALPEPARLTCWGAWPPRWQGLPFQQLRLRPARHPPSLEAMLFSTPITPLTLGDVGRKPIPWAIPKVIA